MEKTVVSRSGRRAAIFVVPVFFLIVAASACVGQQDTADQQLAAETQTAVSGEAAKSASSAGQSTPLTAFVSTIDKPHAGRPLTNFVTDNFTGSSRCAVCHEMLVDGAGNDVSVSNHWRSTMMASAARDPLWIAKVSSEVLRNPALKEVIESKCATCHMPMAWTEAYANGQKGKIFDKQGFLDRANPLHEAAMDGVSCTLCHQIQDKNLGQPEGFSGKFSIDTTTEPPDRPIFGPYKSPDMKPMQTSVGFTPTFSMHTNDSAFCATCHTLFTPFVDSAGNVAGTFPEQTPYLEWLHSDFKVEPGTRFEMGVKNVQGMLCQECHMPHSEAGGVIVSKYTSPNTKPRDHFSQHHFVGANVFMLDILQDNVSGLQLTASTEKIEDTKQRTLQLLQTKTAALSLAEAGIANGEMVATLTVENRVGHKFPSGIPIRNAWLHVILLDKNGAVVFESGRPLPDGRIEGNDNDQNGLAFEPHHDVITSADQVQIYEGVMLNTDNQVTYTLLRAAAYAKDNRLLPKGFDKSSAGADIAVFGEALEDEDFIGGSDQVTYIINLGGARGPFTLRAELLYRSITSAFMDDLGKDDTVGQVRHFARLYDRADKVPVPVAALQVELR